jgi:putative molybdopterin biosynthesis protein
MHRVDLAYSLSPGERSGRDLHHPLLELLEAVNRSGSISAAAREMSLSYRHVWGELKRWEGLLGHRLVAGDAGQSAQLSEFGDKLLWAERQAQARLAAQIEALHADLERAFALAFNDSIHVLSLHASHDDALVALRAHASATAQVHLDIQFSGSVDAIRALNQGRCVLAGFHTRERPPVGSLAQRTYKPLLKPGQHKVIGFALRTQGLMVAPGNPLRLNSMADVARRKARFVNRALGTGTRVLLDELLAEAELAAPDIRGYAQCEPSHAAVAHAITAGQADAGLGLESAASGAGLDFVPLVQERYHLVCLKTALEQPSMQALLAVLRSKAWQHQLGTMLGYACAASGEVQSLRALLPWWSFKSEKAS